MTMSMRGRDNLEGYLFIAPATFGFLLFMVYPIVASFAMGLFDWSLTGKPSFIGLANFDEIRRDEVFWISIKNTVKWVVVYVPATIVLAFVLANAMDKPMRGVIAYRTIFYLPSVCPLISVALLFVWLYNRDFGLLNYLLSFLGLGPVGWLSDPKVSIYSVALMYLYKEVGYNVIILLAAMQGIPRQLYEAAELDGVKGVKKLWYIKIPLLTPAFYYIAIIALIYAFQVFTEIYVMTRGGPGNSTYTLGYYIYANAFQYGRMGYASAQAIILFLIILAVTLAQNKFLGKKVQYDL
jgi:ABC-type sugar transport systems, permease components